MRMKVYYAKSSKKMITNKEHLSKVADLAYKFGMEIRRPEEAKVAGLFHDTGKYGERFQGVLSGVNKGVDHAFSSAALLYLIRGLTQKDHTSSVWRKYEPVIEAIRGHHDGLVLIEGKLEQEFYEAIKDPKMDCCSSKLIPSLRGQEEFREAMKAFKNDFPTYHLPKLPERKFENQVENMLDTRMLFSCLVDADYSVSASDNEADYLEKNSGSQLNADEALKVLYEYCEELRKNSKADSKINKIRNQVFDICGDAGEKQPGLFTLTAPTGVGKTLAMLHFALRHCQENKMRRIIIVLPFLSLAEQSEKEYCKIVPNILVDHSQKNLPKEIRELASRWDAPMIITTSVKFFESLFADKPGDCRKLHSIANSVIVFDEAQSLPTELAPATVKAVNALCKRYNCSMVFSTATQPSFDALPDTEWKPVEIIPENKKLYDQMRRVHVEWRLYKNGERLNNRRTSLEQIADEMASETSVCTIVNLRRHARKLFNELKDRCESDEEVFLLTTDLCPAHRLAVVEEIKERLKSEPQKPCRVVATQCIEAGVDLDFNVMYRALASLEAIIQAAGRCNRNGSLPDGGKLIVFEVMEDGGYPGAFYEKAANEVRYLWKENEKLGVDLDNPETIQSYYNRLFQKEKGKASLNDALNKKNYSDVAKEYQLITNQGIQLIVPWSEKKELFNNIRLRLEEKGLTAEIMREVAPITVSCFEKEWVEQHAEPLYFWKRVNGTRVKLESGYYILNVGHEKYYDEKMGLKMGDVEATGYMI